MKPEGTQRGQEQGRNKEWTEEAKKRNERTQLMQSGLKMYDRQQSGRDKLQVGRGDEKKIEGNGLSRMSEVTGAGVENKEKPT